MCVVHVYPILSIHYCIPLLGLGLVSSYTHTLIHRGFWVKMDDSMIFTAVISRYRHAVEVRLGSFRIQACSQKFCKATL
ncbi:hypothetical protein BJY00DRAFT_293207 [Aspergillus carlsbadensis]|nr:hypothetical protein BJY00DRAFT_293207 [Aspergillus carlsbadensis]